MEGFDNEVEKATLCGCSAAKQRSADSNTAERESPLLKRASILIKTFRQCVGSVHCCCGLQILILNGSGLQIQTNGTARNIRRVWNSEIENGELSRCGSQFPILNSPGHDANIRRVGKSLYSMGEEGLQWRASITKWRKQPPAVAPLPNSGPRIRTPRKRESPLLKRASILIITFRQCVGSVHCFAD